MNPSALPFNVTPVSSYTEDNYDCVILVSWASCKGPERLINIRDAAMSLDKGLIDEVGVLPFPDNPKKMFIHAPTGPIDPDYDDVRSLGEAAKKGMKRALKAGVKNPLIVLTKHEAFPKSELVILLAALEVLYVPIQVRERNTEKAKKVDNVGVACHDTTTNVKKLVDAAVAMEAGRWVARDIGGGDPERMAARRVQEYVQDLFANSSNVSISVVYDTEELNEEYPLFGAVNRCANHVTRHQGRVVFLDYVDTSTPVTKTLLLVGKGVTYDTGGADVKAGGVMRGMSRDKCGAAAVAGVVRAIELLNVQGLRVRGALCLVRNSIGSDSYVSDEVVMSRSGAAVRVGNTDAEGRMCMADILCEMKDLARNCESPHLYTIATLTGHACLSVGPGYSIVMDNGPAKKTKHAERLQQIGEDLGDPLEISRVRREDISFHRGQNEGDDILQSNTLPSSRTERGHQGPAAFLILASGLDKHGSYSNKPLAYSHLDIAPSAGDIPLEPTGAPVVALVANYAEDYLNFNYII